MNNDELSKAIKEIAKCLDLTEPSGFMLSYDFNDIWLDISLGKNEYGKWDNKIYTISISKSRSEKFIKCLYQIDAEVYEDNERIYAQFTEEEWQFVQSMILDII